MAPTSSDPFAHIREATLKHRAKHGCGAYPYSNGPLLSTIAAAAGARRILELGCALGYTSLSLAHGAPKARIDTIERDPEHAAIARDHFKAEGLGERFKVLAGLGAEVLPTLKDTYDLGYFDTDPAESLIDLEQFERLLKPAGLLISANLFLGQYAPDLPGLEKTAEYRERILDGTRWLTSYLPDGTAMSIKR